MKKIINITTFSIMVICLPFLMSETYGRTALSVIAFLLLFLILSFSLKKEDNKLNPWIADKTKGKEKLWIKIMLVISFLVFGTSFYYKNITPKDEKLTVNDIIKDVQNNKPENTIGIGDALDQYREMEKDEKALEVINQLQIEFQKQTLDTTKIKHLQAELKALNIDISFK